MIALGIMGLVTGDLTAIWPPAPRGAPIHQVLAYLCAAVSLAAGAGLLFKRTAAHAARALLVLFAGWLLLWDVPSLALHPGMELAWALGKTAVIFGMPFSACATSVLA